MPRTTILLMALTLLAPACSKEKADTNVPGTTDASAPETAATDAEPKVDPALVEQNNKDLQEIATLAGTIESTAKTAVKGAQDAQTAAEALVNLTKERKLKDQVINRTVDAAITSGQIKLQGVREADKEAVRTAVQSFVDALEGLKSSPQTIANARAELDRIDARVQELAQAVRTRTEELKGSDKADAKARGEDDQKRLDDLLGAYARNLEAGRGLLGDWETQGKALADAFKIELAKPEAAAATAEAPAAAGEQAVAK